jgi:hypothetical protein
MLTQKLFKESHGRWWEKEERACLRETKEEVTEDLLKG